MIPNLENLKEGNLLVISNGWIVQILRYNKTKIKFNILYLNAVHNELHFIFSANYVIHYSKDGNPINNGILKVQSLDPNEILFNPPIGFPPSYSLIKNVRAIITNKKDINRIKALTHNVIPDFHFAKRNFDIDSNDFYLEYYNEA